MQLKKKLFLILACVVSICCLMAAKGEWNIPNYELEKLAHYFLELITEQNENKNNDKNQDNKT